MNPKLLQKDFLSKYHAFGEYCMKAARFGAKTPQTKYLGALLTASLIYVIPAPLSRSERAVLVQPADKHSSIFCAHSVIDLRFVYCHLPFSSRLFFLYVGRGGPSSTSPLPAACTQFLCSPSTLLPR